MTSSTKCPTGKWRSANDYNGGSSHPEHVIRFRECGHLERKILSSCTGIGKENSRASCACKNPPDEYWTTKDLNMDNSVIKVEELRQMLSDYSGFCTECELRQQDTEINEEINEKRTEARIMNEEGQKRSHI